MAELVGILNITLDSLVTADSTSTPGPRLPTQLRWLMTWPS